MLLFKKAFHAGLTSGAITLTFRRWQKPHVTGPHGNTLLRMDKSRSWTAETLSTIEETPRTAASKLAAKLGRETARFKADVVKLKQLGLTQSFEVGYEISPRGKAYLKASQG